MKCKHEGLPSNAVFCCWCGKKLIKDKTEVKVPAPRVLPSGTFFNQITVNGKRVPISAASEKEYYAKARAAKTGLIEAKKTAPKITLGAAIDSYIESNSNVLSPSTIKAYKSYRKYRFQSVIDRDISAIQNWQKVINDEMEEEISPKTLANSWRLITASMRAQNLDIPEVSLPKAAKAQRPWLDYEQIKDFLKAVEGADCELAALLALHGLRRSELLAITADKVDTKKGLMEISGAMVFNPDGVLIEKATNKNSSSQRIVHIVIPRLYDLIEGKEGRLVSTHPNTLRSQINAVCKAADLPLVGFHGLRHSFASLAYHLGWSEMTTMREGGWSNTQTVNNIYTHLATQDQNADIEKMKAFFLDKPAQITNENTNAV